VNKVVITAPVDYVIGHLRYGHLEGEVELTDEQLELFKKDPAKAIQELDLDLELVIDDWEVDGYGDPYDVQYTIWKEEKGNG
jgi:hypothetical protein